MIENIKKRVPSNSGTLIDDIVALAQAQKKTIEEQQWTLPFKVRGRTIKI